MSTAAIFFTCICLFSSAIVAAQDLTTPTQTYPSSPIITDEQPYQCDDDPDDCQSGAIDVGSSPNSLLPSSGVGNPINLMSGNKFQSETDFSLPSSQLMFRRMYNSTSAASNVGLGMGWRHSYAVSIGDAGDGVREIVQSNGARLSFRPDGNDDAGNPLLRAVQSNHGYLVQQDNLHQWHLPDGRTLKFQGSYLVQIDWPDQRKLELYYRSNRLESVTDEAGRVLTFGYTPGVGDSGLETYDESRFGVAPAHLEKITLPDGSAIGYDYDRKNNLSRVRFPDGTSREYHFENEIYASHITGLTDRTGVRFASWTYDEQGRAITSEHTNGVERVSLQYPDVINIESGEVVETVITNSLDQKSVFSWRKPIGSSAQLLSSSGAGCATCAPTGMAYEYDEGGRLLISTKNGQGGAIGTGNRRYRYDDKGRVAEIRRTDAVGLDHLIERREYAGIDSIPTRVFRPSVNPDGDYITEIERNEEGLPILITERAWVPWVPLPGERDYSDGAITPRVFRPIERTSALSYKNGRLVAIDGPRVDIEDITKFVWDDKNRLVEIAKPSAPVKKILNYDSLGRPTEMKIGSASSYRVSYDLNNNITKIENRGSILTFEYDAEGRTTSYTDAEGRVTRILRDAVGRSIGAEDAFGRRTKIDWDNENRQKTRFAFAIDGSLIRSIEQSYTSDGRRQSLTDTQVNAHGDNSADTFFYERDNNQLLSGVTHEQTGHSFAIDFADSFRSMSITAPNGLAAISYVDNVGQEAGRTDKRNNTTSHIRDDFGRRVGVYSPDTGTERLERNPAGNVVKRVREDSGVTNFSYDAAGRVLSRRHQNGDTTLYQYDNATGKLIGISNPVSTEQFSYSVNGDLLSHHRKIGVRTFNTGYEYDERGRMVSKELPDGQTLLYSYHVGGVVNSGSIKSISRQGWFGQRESLVDDIDLERRDGAMGWVSHNGLRTEFAYSPNEQLVSVETDGVQTLAYQYNNKHKIIGITKNGVRSQYQYYQGKLSSTDSPSQSRSYEYDVLGNRLAQFVSNKNTSKLTGTKYQYAAKGAGNRLIETRDMVSGLMQEWTYTAGGAPLKTGKLSYRYDSERRPIEVKLGVNKIAEYQYNGFGERVSKTVFQQEAEPTTTYFIYDNAILSAEVLAIEDTMVQYVYLGQHRPVAQINGKEINAIHTDSIGTPLSMTDDNASLVWSADYSPFGEASVMLEARVLNLRLPGQYADVETGTHYNYFRDYDPAIGRYLTSDPIGLAGGDNSYAYALLNPLTNTDVFGLFSSGDSLSASRMEALNGDPVAIRNFVRTELVDFEKRQDFYMWAHETLNGPGPDTMRQTDWFLAASQVNASNALGQVDNLGPDLLGIIREDTRTYISEVGLGLAEQNVQTFLSLYFGESIAGIDVIPAPVHEPGMCAASGQQFGDYLDVALVTLEQRELSRLTDEYFALDPNDPEDTTGIAAERAVVMDDINDLLNFRGLAAIGEYASNILGLDWFADPNTVNIVNHYWPDGTFDYANVNHRILLGESLVRINNGQPWHD